jgi:hypothetical protein
MNNIAQNHAAEFIKHINHFLQIAKNNKGLSYVPQYDLYYICGLL